MRDQLLTFIAQTVIENYQQHRAPTNGAQLAELVRAKFPGNPVADAGFEKLGDAVREASERGLVVRNSMVKHLEVFPPDVPFHSVKPGATHHSQYVRPDAWRAFAMQFENQFVYYNKRTREFEVRSQATNDNELQEVSTPKIDDFRSWIENLANDEGVSVPDSILQSDHCLREFSFWVGKQNGSTAAEWKRFRAAKVVQLITAWGKQSGVDTSDFFTPAVSQAKREPVRKEFSHSIDEEVRSAVIGCIQDMSLAEIESLSIPLRHVLTHFRPRS
ncbi:MAG: hypothetical protein ABI614_07805 [Planctomycetota bacterium]